MIDWHSKNVNHLNILKIVTRLISNSCVKFTWSGWRINVSTNFILQFNVVNIFVSVNLLISMPMQRWTNNKLKCFIEICRLTFIKLKAVEVTLYPNIEIYPELFCLPILFQRLACQQPKGIRTYFNQIVNWISIGCQFSKWKWKSCPDHNKIVVKVSEISRGKREETLWKSISARKSNFSHSISCQPSISSICLQYPINKSFSRQLKAFTVQTEWDQNRKVHNKAIRDFPVSFSQIPKYFF